MKEFLVNFLIGDFCADGHGKHDTIPMIVTTLNDNVDIEKVLNEAEEQINEKFNIDLSTWFKNYEEFNISREEVKKLKKLNIQFSNYNDINVDGTLDFFSVEDYFNIWKQLIEKVNPSIKIDKAVITEFYGKCTGYGLYE
jgi:hypothetical protein